MIRKIEDFLAGLSLVTLLALVVLSSTAYADSTVDLVAFLSDMKTFHAEFRQEQYSEDGGIQQTSTGTVDLAKPGRFHWNYQTPYHQQIIADGQRVWFYDEDLDQVTIKPLGTAFGSTPAMLLTGEANIEDNFVLTIQTGNISDGLSWVLLTPRESASDVQNAERILIGMDGKQLAGMDLINNFGQRTRLYFSSRVVNQDIPLSRFDFVPPPGVDVFQTDEMAQ